MLAAYLFYFSALLCLKLIPASVTMSLIPASTALCCILGTVTGSIRRLLLLLLLLRTHPGCSSDCCCWLLCSGAADRGLLHLSGDVHLLYF